MSDRLYRLLLGLTLLVCLYFDLVGVMIAVIVIEVFEGATNFRIPIIINRLRPAVSGVPEPDTNGNVRFAFDAERAWRLTVALFLLLSYVLFPEQLWWLAWFMGFAIFGAGLSGVCPMLISLKFMGFR